MKSKILIILIILLILIIFYFINYSKNEIEKVCFKDNCFNVEISDTDEKRQRGLMFRDKLDNNSGMLFIFEKTGNHPFWMKNTLIPLDIVWIDENKEVIEIINTIPCNIEPCQIYGFNSESLYVLEINSGKSQEIGLIVGDKLEFKK